MRLELESRVDCTDGTFGKLADVVIDPTSRRVTHLVVEPDEDRWLARLVPVELAEPQGNASGAVVLRSTVEEVRALPPVHEVAYLRVDGYPVDDPDWDVGIQEVLALPYYAAYDLEPVPDDYTVFYDRVPKSEVEIRRASDVYASDGHHLGRVDGFIVDPDDHITHLVLERGHLWERREVTIPIAAVARVETDVVTLTLTKDEVGALSPVPVHRWPRAVDRVGPRR
jgi:sporulation protein YlmC with PRC-barrel domain